MNVPPDSPLWEKSPSVKAFAGIDVVMLLVAGRELTAHLGLHRAAFVQAHADTDLPVALALGQARRGDLPEFAALEVGELEVLEHDVDELFERHIGFVIVDPRPIAGAIRLAFS